MATLFPRSHPPVTPTNPIGTLMPKQDLSHKKADLKSAKTNGTLVLKELI